MPVGMWLLPSRITRGRRRWWKRWAPVWAPKPLEAIGSPAKNLYVARDSADWGLIRCYIDDVVFHWAGTGPLSGDFQGKDEYLATLQKLRGLVDATSVEEHDLLVSDAHAVALNRGTYTRGGDSITTNRVVVYHFAGDQVSEVWVVDQDQAAVDAFLA